METQVLGKKNKTVIIVVFQQHLEGVNNSLITMTSILQIQLEGGYNPLIYRLQPEGSSNSLVLQLQPERGYNPFSLPRLAAPNMKIETVEPRQH